MPTGTLVLAADGGFSCTPPPGHTGAVSFTYQAGDGMTLSSLAMVSIVIRPPEMHVAGITGTFKLTRQGVQLTARVTIADEAGAPVPGATVYATLTVPGKAPVQLQAVTDATGRAAFSGITSLRGTWTLCVDAVVLEGWVFAPGGNDCTNWKY